MAVNRNTKSSDSLKDGVSSKVTRRSFLNKSAALAFGFTVMPSYLALGKEDSDGNLPPSKRINLGCIGCGGMGGGDIMELTKHGNAKPVAFCDVDFSRANEKVMKENPDVPRFTDFRVMLDKMGKDIDAVSIGTPDHTHFVAALDSMRRGKHVYVEKPLTHSFKEAEMLIAAEKRYGVLTEMGNFGHTSTGSVQFANMVKAGIVKDIVKIEAWKSPGDWYMDPAKHISEYPKGEPVPKSLDWDLWCGPVEKKPFSVMYHPFDWRGFYLYGNGMFGDWGAHIIDFPHDYLRLGLPSKLRAVKIEGHNHVIFPLGSHIEMHFPSRQGMPACDLSWRDDVDYMPTIDEQYWDKDAKGEPVKPRLGGAGTLLHRKDGKFLIQRGSHETISRLRPLTTAMKYKDVMATPKQPWRHWENFIQACMGNSKVNSPFSISGPLTQTLLMGVVCQYLNTDLDFDLKTKRFVNNAEANVLLDGPTPRKGWENFYKAI